MNQRYLSTREASKALGVSVSTVKRWVDDGILPAHKTAGGHRKLVLTDIIRLGRSGQLPQLDVRRLELLGPSESASDQSKLRDRISKDLAAGDAAALRATILSAYQSGVPLHQLIDDSVIPGLEGLASQCSPGQSHRPMRAAQAFRASLYELKSVLETRACRDCPVAVTGACVGNTDAVYPLLAQLVLLDDAWEPINLGPGTPISSFRDAVTEIRPRLLCLTFAQPIEDETLIEDYNNLYQHAASQEVAVVLHGPALTNEQRRAMKYTAYSDRFEHMAAFARTLHPAPKIPKRGRPASSGND